MRVMCMIDRWRKEGLTERQRLWKARVTPKKKKDNSANDYCLSFNYKKLSKGFCPETMLESFQLKSDSFWYRSWKYNL